MESGPPVEEQKVATEDQDDQNQPQEKDDGEKHAALVEAAAEAEIVINNQKVTESAFSSDATW